MLTYYDYASSFQGIPRSYPRLVASVEMFLEKQRCDKAKADLHGSTKVRGLAAEAKTSPGICRNWRKFGKCDAGGGCPYAHPADQRAASPGGKGGGKRPGSSDGSLQRDSKGKGKGKKDRSSSPGPRGQPPPSNNEVIMQPRGVSPSGKKDARPCRLHMKGNCHYGKECNFRHVPFCKNFQKGECKEEKGCKFLHIKAKAAPKAVAVPTVKLCRAITSSLPQSSSSCHSLLLACHSQLPACHSHLLACHSLFRVSHHHLHQRRGLRACYQFRCCHLHQCRDLHRLLG